MKILITGAHGLIGRIASQGLDADGHTLCLLDCRTTAEIGDAAQVQLAAKHQCITGDIAEEHLLDTLLQEFAPDAVLHLAAVGGKQCPFEPILQTNLVGSIRLFEACLEHRIKRVIWTSTNNIYGGYEDAAIAQQQPLYNQPKPMLLDTEASPRPYSRYAVSKSMLEEYAHYLAQYHGLPILGLRIGSVRHIDDPENQPNERYQPVERLRATWLYHHDLLQLLRCCLKTSRTSGCYNAISGLPGSFGVHMDISRTMADLGYRPTGRAGLPAA